MKLVIQKPNDKFECSFDVRVITASQPFRARTGIVIPYQNECSDAVKLDIPVQNWKPIINYHLVDGKFVAKLEIEIIEQSFKLRNFKIISDHIKED